MAPLALSAERSQELRSAEFTYSEVGATSRTLPDGYHHLRREVLLPTGSFPAATEALLTWQVQQRAGLRVRTEAEACGRIREEAVAELRIGFGTLALTAPVRVLRVIDDPDRVGFAYGTLPGHPESGEEAFIIERHPDGRAVFTITAFSRPGRLLTRAAGPLGRAVQRWMTARYLHALGDA